MDHSKLFDPKKNHTKFMNSSEQHMHVRPASPYGRSNSRNGFNSDEEPVIQDWNDDVRRRQRLLLAQKRQRQRYFGRS
jgi:hypothetical protein